MESEYGGSMSIPPQNPYSSSSSNNNNNDAANFECNICLDLAQDPIVTLCGHLFCWPCLYKWLHIHSHSLECPVCKALIEEEKLVPLYGRGKNSTDPRSRSIPGINIPNRPAGQRPETAPQPNTNHFPQQGFGFTGGFGGFGPTATVGFGNFTLSGSLSGLFPSFSFQFHGIPGDSTYGVNGGVPYGFPNQYQGGHAHGFQPHGNQRDQDDNSRNDSLKMTFLMFGVLVLLYLIWG